jgi:hypothetical protein
LAFTLSVTAELYFGTGLPGFLRHQDSPLTRRGVMVLGQRGSPEQLWRLAFRQLRGNELNESCVRLIGRFVGSTVLRPCTRLGPRSS